MLVLWMEEIWRNPAPVENGGLSWFIPLFSGFQTSFWWCRISQPSTGCMYKTYIQTCITSHGWKGKNWLQVRNGPWFQTFPGVLLANFPGKRSERLLRINVLTIIKSLIKLGDLIISQGGLVSEVICRWTMPMILETAPPPEQQVVVQNSGNSVKCQSSFPKQRAYRGVSLWRQTPWCSVVRLDHQRQNLAVSTHQEHQWSNRCAHTGWNTAQTQNDAWNQAGL